MDWRNIVCHFIYFVVQFVHHVEVDQQTYDGGAQNDGGVVDIFLVVPQNDTVNYEQIEWLEDLQNE